MSHYSRLEKAPKRRPFQYRLAAAKISWGEKKAAWCLRLEDITRAATQVEQLDSRTPTLYPLTAAILELSSFDLNEIVDDWLVAT